MRYKEEPETTCSPALFNLMHLHHLNRLDLSVIKRMRLEFDAVEVDIHQVDASDVVVPCSALVELHCSLISDSSKLRCTWKTFGDLCH
jgi:hypothetical protein